MEIKIETDGTFDGTEVSLDGIKLEKFSKFGFSLRIDENNIKRPPKLQISFQGGRFPISMYGKDFVELEKH